MLPQTQFSKVLNGTAWGSDKKCLLCLHKCYIRLLLDYGCIIYATASPSVLSKLNTIQNQALQIATGVFPTSPITSLHAETAVLPLIHHRSLQILKYYCKLLNTPTHLNSYRAQYIPSTNSHSFAALIQCLLHHYQIDQLYLQTAPT